MKVPFVSLNLPAPISVNDLWKPVIRSGRPAIIKSREYRGWLEEAGWALAMQHPGCVIGPYSIHIKVDAATRLDAGNVEKAISDLLQAHEVIENDRLAQRILIERADIEGMWVMVAECALVEKAS